MTTPSPAVTALYAYAEIEPERWEVWNRENWEGGVSEKQWRPSRPLRQLRDDLSGLSRARTYRLFAGVVAMATLPQLGLTEHEFHWLLRSVRIRGGRPFGKRPRTNSNPLSPSPKDEESGK